MLVARSAACGRPGTGHWNETFDYDGKTRTYRVAGQLFYGSVEDFTAELNFREKLDTVIIDVTHAHIWDISSVQALDMAMEKFRRRGASRVELIGMNTASETLVDRLSLQDKSGNETLLTQ